MMKVYDTLTGEVKDAKFASVSERPLEESIAPQNEASITETAYVPPEVMIKDMMDAGIRLDESRRRRFSEVNGEEGTEEVDVTRVRGVDIVDVADAAYALQDRIQAAKEAAQAKAVSDSKAAEKARIDAAVAAALAAAGKPG
jgi:hypothetical protein